MRNNGFMTGVIAGAALGALIVMAMSPQMRGSVMEGAGEVGDRMRKAWGRGARAVDAVAQDDVL